MVLTILYRPSSQCCATRDRIYPQGCFWRHFVRFAHVPVYPTERADLYQRHLQLAWNDI